MKIGLCIRAYSTEGLSKQVKADVALEGEVRHVKDKLVIAVTREFESLGEAVNARRRLLGRYGNGTILNADREISVMECEETGFISLFEYAQKQEARAKSAEQERYEWANGIHSASSGH